MCGFAGFLDARGRLDPNDYRSIVQRMADTLVHRGPDDAGAWTDPAAGIAFGFRRLSILDLSQEGHQPMTSRSGRYVIVFNGEIYNHAEIRAKIESSGQVAWRGHSDTEVLLEAIDRFGFERTLDDLNGMFAIAVWDREQKILNLARDRLGEKPLYYGSLDGMFLFGSELKSLRVHPSWTGKFDRHALALYMRHAYIPSPFSAYDGVRKLPPGCWLRVSADEKVGEPRAYWSAVERATNVSPFDGSREDARDELGRLLAESVGMRMVADVPVGSFLSGGIDSSIVTAAMQAAGNGRVKTFTIGFPDHAHDESRHAEIVARHIGSDHTTMQVSEAACQETLPDLQSTYDEPFADSSQIPTMVLSRLTRGHVTVALSGDGGDELFLGYSRYVRVPHQWQRVKRLPSPVRLAARHLSRASAGRGGSTFRRLRKMAERWSPESPERLYRNAVSWWQDGDNIMPGIVPHETLFESPDTVAAIEPLAKRFALIDAVTYLPDDLLVKVDRASMATGLEVRAPLLDHRIAEFAWSLPEEMKIRNGQGKSLLRELLYSHVPRELVDRPKQGFEAPVGRWMREGLRDWAESLLSREALIKHGLLNVAVVRKRWAEHANGRRNWTYPLWTVLMLHAWLEAQ
jgi:asparagine synthase (glutamine-hydrolysing)